MGRSKTLLIQIDDDGSLVGRSNALLIQLGEDVNLVGRSKTFVNFSFDDDGSWLGWGGLKHC